MGPNPISAHDKLPPLRIHHFLTWTLVAAIALAIQHILIRRLQLNPSAIPVQAILLRLFQTLALTTCAFTLYWSKGERPLLSEPGQGILLTTSLTFVGEYLPDFLFLFRPDLYAEMLNGDLEGWVRTTLQASMLAVLVLNILVWAWLAYRFRASHTWKIFFLLVATLSLARFALPRLISYLTAVSPLAARIQTTIWPWPSLALSITLIVGLVYLSFRDLRLHQRHHWSHWCGILCGVILAISDLSSSLLNMFFQFGWMGA